MNQFRNIVDDRPPLDPNAHRVTIQIEHDGKGALVQYVLAPNVPLKSHHLMLMDQYDELIRRLESDG